ncbi:hypothetical protein B5807_08186 [Epicoccum nigrum]|uniref:Uncharacterized protein n=1 Tax=Epicoccum nigrum TaxID=105696 RepID=A0A1Y2LQ86_EPING|nr:hypothetical protein B5807_08186 [Epicoccum nigrum]
MGNAAVLSWQHFGRHSHPLDQFKGSIRRRPNQDLASFFPCLASTTASGFWRLSWYLEAYPKRYFNSPSVAAGDYHYTVFLIFVSAAPNTLDAEHCYTGHFPGS